MKFLNTAWKILTPLVALTGAGYALWRHYSTNKAKQVKLLEQDSSSKILVSETEGDKDETT